MQEYIEPPEHRGLLFFDGLDSLGRPVVIVNADAMGEQKGDRKSAFQYIVRTLEPVVIQVCCCILAKAWPALHALAGWPGTHAAMLLQQPQQVVSEDCWLFSSGCCAEKHLAADGRHEISL